MRNGGEIQKGGQSSQELPQKLWLMPFCCIRHEVRASSTCPYPHVPLQSFGSQMGLHGFSPQAKQLSFSVSPAGRGCRVNKPSGNVWAYIEKTSSL